MVFNLFKFLESDNKKKKKKLKISIIFYSQNFFKKIQKHYKSMGEFFLFLSCDAIMRHVFVFYLK